ncbi:hypothetical protein AAHA92_14078 [Salvia divinorum]|uniref:Uncharacterized protein n=1 Tax=Salvia divinorum TaxID=28513 RepID=A0ABD1HAD0_SALDI
MGICAGIVFDSSWTYHRSCESHCSVLLLEILKLNFAFLILICLSYYVFDEGGGSHAGAVHLNWSYSCIAELPFAILGEDFRREEESQRMRLRSLRWRRI